MQVRHGSDILAPLNHIGTVDPEKLESLGGPITGPHDASQDQDRRPPSAMHEASLSSCLGPYGYFDVSIQGLLVRGRTQIWARGVPFNVHMSEKCMFPLRTPSITGKIRCRAHGSSDPRPCRPAAGLYAT